MLDINIGIIININQPNKTMKTTTKKKATLPSNWKTITLYNCQSETASFELTKDRDGKHLPAIYHKGINDWIASVTLIEGEIMGLEEVEVGETLGFAINHKLWF